MLAKDSHIASEVNRRKLALQGAYYECSADVILWGTVDALMDSILTGAAVFEIFLENGKQVFEPLSPSVLQYKKDEGYFVATKDGKEIFVESDNRLYLADNGSGALFSLIWIFCAKHFVLSHYMQFTEFLGVPPVIVLTGDSSAENIGSIADMAEQLKSAGVGIFGKDDTVSVLEGRGSQSDFLEFVRYCDTQISLAIVGNTLSGNEGKSGSLAMSQTHQESFRAITTADARYAERHINALLGLISRKQDFKYIIEQDKDLKTRAETLQILKGMGYDISADYIAKEFDLPSQTAPAANHKERNAKDGSVGDKIDEEASSFDTRPIEKEMEQTLEGILEKCGSFDEAHAALIAAYPDIELPELEKTLERLMANSYIQGRAEI